MTLKALGSAREMPGLLTPASRSTRVGDREDTIGAAGGKERGVGLLFIPLVGVSLPVRAVEMKDLSLQPAAAPRVALLHLERDRLGENAVLGKEHLAAEKSARNR